ncbi:hypothetical protein EMIHUDRAFT_223381 [Emiliania huxleyi CCMP1516]|uniref:Prolyl 4-hydroxylase alpha subunit Fe(2+) 2OG dioxygenase domain-containing protein n=2 Tax=Emiliania huxleyi TaxID=2903 RepID=A0A0D3KVP4_EMIH1|nr:hypothetical protein EMIHUDRAFT_223381 [Emiliania huxleyi CCMP1516]EOD39829.1 hypothetical protein EMIHUDRAFT_223381 [Emiliania huxleyi CCMP1516]|eukprot:XP_005792258.1 hypothetical protein EMIHUDRAFT_223381 [Emiliania huxleyi CCMP1516]
MAASAHHSTARCVDRDAAWRLRPPCRPCASSNVSSASDSSSSTCASSDFASLAAAAKARVLAGLAASLRSADGWEARASSAEEFAAATGRAVLGLGPAELAAVREKLLSDGVRRQEELASAEQLAAAVFERALSGKLIEEAQQSGDYWGGASALITDGVRSALRPSHGDGIAVVDGALSPSEVAAARSELLAMDGSARLSSVARRRNAVDCSSLMASGSRALSLAVRLLRALPAEVQEAGGWPLAAAVYDGSRARAAFYKPHLDCKEPASNPRRLTAILYLQPPGWDGGGELRAWRRDGEAVEIAPLGGRLVLFRACDVLHEIALQNLDLTICAILSLSDTVSTRSAAWER